MSIFNYRTLKEKREDLYLTDLFRVGQYYPHPAHAGRIQKYRDNKELFLGSHFDVLENASRILDTKQYNTIYVSTNLPGLICKKSADFLFGENPVYSAGKDDNAPEQSALERLVRENNLPITNYETALANAFRGDVFYKIRWGQRWNGKLDARTDPFRVFIDAQNPEYVFPETSQTDVNTITAYHIAYPVLVADSRGEEWILNVESHYPGRIQYRKFRMNPNQTSTNSLEIDSWRIYAEITDEQRIVETDVPFPLVVHIPNYATDDTWQGIDDLSENKTLFDELNNRISQVAAILDKHADPAMSVPQGSLDEDENGQPVFHVARDKVFELTGKDDKEPKYITWDGKLDAAFKEIDLLIDQILTNAEIPPVALGKDNSGTSGASGLSIKWRMNSLLAKINRKRQYYDKGLRMVLFIAQLLEHARAPKKPDYDVTYPRIKFKDGLPDDDLEQANIASIRTAGKPTQSQLTAIMELNDMTEEQARKELDRIREEEQAEAFADPSVLRPPADEGSSE